MTRLEGMRADVGAERALYETLSAEPRQTVDNLMAGSVGAMSDPSNGRWVSKRGRNSGTAYLSAPGKSSRRARAATSC